MPESKLIGFVATQNPASALAFYKDTLGLTLISDDPFAIVFDVNGTMLRVQKVSQLKPVPHTVLGWDVPDIRDRVMELAAKGVRFERYGFLQQDDMGIWPAPSGAKVAWFKDPDGNVLSLTQFCSR